MLWLGIVQAILFAILSVANFALAYRMYKIQRERNTAKLVITGDEIIEVEDHEVYALRVYNVGLNQSQGGMCICRVLGIGAGVSRECFGP